MSKFSNPYAPQKTVPQHSNEKFEELVSKIPAVLDSEFEDLLSDVQGNIIFHHHKKFSRYYFIHFKPEEKNIKAALEWIQIIAKEYVTSAMRQFEDRENDGAKLVADGEKLVEEGKKMIDEVKLLDGAKMMAEGMVLMKNPAKLNEGVRLLADGAKLMEEQKRHIERGRRLVERGTKRIARGKEQTKKKTTPGGGKPVCCLYLTWEGYRALSLTHLAPPPLEPSGAFEQGMKDRVSLPFPTVTKKVFGVERTREFYDERLYPKKNGSPLAIHAMLMVASDNPDFTDIASKLKLKNPGPDWGFVAEQAGIMKERAYEGKKRVVEWFGFRDGISQPLFFPNKSGVKNYDEDNLSPLKVVLTRDKGGQNWYSAGSFMAFLKLEQDVGQFLANAKTIKDKISQGGGSINDELAEAYIMGRFHDGTSVSLSDKAQAPNGEFPKNDFYYSKIHNAIGDSDVSDEKGIRCPFAAHARKANPRNDAEAVFIIRRGVLYDDRKNATGSTDWAPWDDASNPPPKGDVGLLFMSFQSSLEKQFEHILNDWLLSVNTGTQATGVDMLIAPEASRKLSSAWYVPAQWGDENPDKKVLFTHEEIKPCIHFKGGAYFFAPSLSFLQNVARNSLIPNAPDGGFKMGPIKRKYD
jgi:Dyp-type peroxidase family